MSVFNPSKYLQKVLQNNMQGPSHKQTARLNSIRERVVNYILAEFSKKLVSSPETSGSMKKKTDLRNDSDLDLIVPFRHGEFEGHGMDQKLATMLNQVCRKVQGAFPKALSFRRQRVSCGLKFSLGGARTVKIDVVPGMEISPGTYNQGGQRALLLWDQNEKKSFKTDVFRQAQAIEGDLNNQHRELIRLLKIYKAKKRFDIPSFLLELMVIRAFAPNERAPVGGSLSERFFYVIRFMGKHFDTIQLIDPGNKQNDVMSGLSRKIRVDLANHFRKLGGRLDKDAVYLKQVF